MTLAHEILNFIIEIHKFSKVYLSFLDSNPFFDEQSRLLLKAELITAEPTVGPHDAVARDFSRMRIPS